MSRSLADLPGPRSLPGLGNASQIRASTLHLTAERWCREHGPLFRFAIGPRDFVGVGDPELIAAVLRDRPDGFRRTSEIERESQAIGIDGVFSAEGDAWRRQRRLAVTALNSNHLHRYYDVVERATRRLDARLGRLADAGEPVRIQSLLTSYSVDVTSALAFGRDLNTLERGTVELQEHIEAVFAALARRIISPIPSGRWVRGPRVRREDASMAFVRAAVEGFIAEARTRVRERPELLREPENFLEGMLAAQAGDGRCSEGELVGNTMTMLLAGEDTTAHSLAWTCWVLGRRPDVQDRLAVEALGLLGDQRHPPTFELADRFAYGDAVLRETLRVKPVASFLIVQAIGDRTVGDLRVSDGTRLMLLTRHAAVQEESFSDGACFAPERWLDSGGEARRAKAWMPFGSGPRFCPGRNLALLESKAALAVLARNYEIALDPTAPPVRERMAFTTIPVGLRIVLRRRAANAPCSPAPLHSAVGRP